MRFSAFVAAAAFASTLLNTAKASELALGPTKYTASGVFPTKAYPAYWNDPSSPTEEPQPVIYDPILVCAKAHPFFTGLSSHYIKLSMHRISSIPKSLLIRIIFLLYVYMFSIILFEKSFLTFYCVGWFQWNDANSNSRDIWTNLRTRLCPDVRNQLQLDQRHLHQVCFDARDCQIRISCGTILWLQRFDRFVQLL